MLRRLSLIAASVAMLALSALPASAATMHMQSSTHKLNFPSLRGVTAWGTYTKTSRGVRLSVCVDDTARGVFAAGAVALVSNASGSLHTNLGAVDIGYHQAVCRSMTLHYTAHLKIYTFTGTSTGRIGSKSKIKTVY
jgi:hypothetical protein